jgi:hypothetical protein
MLHSKLTVLKISRAVAASAEMTRTIYLFYEPHGHLLARKFLCKSTRFDNDDEYGVFIDARPSRDNYYTPMFDGLL